MTMTTTTTTTTMTTLIFYSIDRIVNDRNLLGKIPIGELIQGGDARASLSAPSGKGKGGCRVL